MSTFRFSRPRVGVAFAASATALFCASASFAQETTPSQSTTTQTTTAAPQAQPVQPVQPVQQPVVQPQPSQQINVAQPPAQPAQPAAVSTTQTTGSPYSPTGERYAERSIEHRPNKTLLSTGGGIFILSYGASVVAGAVSDRDADKKLFIPVVGPWLDLGDRGCSVGNPCGSNEDLAKAMLVTSGIVQGAGVLMAIGSLIIPESTTVEERSTTARAKPHKPSVALAPVSYNAGAGLGAIGRF